MTGIRGWNEIAQKIFPTNIFDKVMQTFDKMEANTKENEASLVIPLAKPLDYPIVRSGIADLRPLE